MFLFFSFFLLFPNRKVHFGDLTTTAASFVCTVECFEGTRQQRLAIFSDFTRWISWRNTTDDCTTSFLTLLHGSPIHRVYTRDII